MEKQRRNSVSLRLTEPALFLRTCPGGNTVEDSQPTLLRGLLVLDLVKPTRISSIELELQAKTTTVWPEGIGARRIDVTETHEIFQASVVYFRAGQAPPRRPTSVGPGTHHSDDDWDEYIVPLPSTSRPSSRQGRRRSADEYTNHSTQQHDQYHIPIPPYSPFSGLPTTLSAVSSPESSTVHLPSTTDPECLVSNDITRQRSRSTLAESSNIDTNDQHHDLNGNGGTSSMRSPLRSVTPPRDHDSQERSRGSRFSFTSMSNAFMDAMKLNQTRGRSLEKRAVQGRNQLSQPQGDNETSEVTSVVSKDRSTLSVISDFLKLDLVLDEHKEYGSNWKEFKKGTYTYPISITIPGHCPPTLYCDCGQVTWTLKAVVHRPGTFKARLTATQEVIVVACPIDDNTEESENIIVERQWDNQLQYFMSVSGRSFCIGGTIPISFSLLPLTKVRIHRIIVSIEERVDYYTKMARLARSEPITPFILLSVKGKGDPILPLVSDDFEAFKKSPLYGLVTPDDDPWQIAADLMGPGPWTFRQDLPLPKSCNQMHFTNKNKLSNISITHTLKWIIRVESASSLHVSPKTGKRKMFDIVVQTPVHILSCRCNLDWRALPGYSEHLHLSNPRLVTSGCPCEIGRTKRTLLAPMERAKSEEISSQFERLVSGQVAETGETPPAYED